MPEQAEQFDTYNFVAESGAFRLQEAPTSDLRDLSDLTSGRFRLAGTGIVDTSTNRFVGNLSRSAQTTISVGTLGTVMLHNVVQRARLQGAMGTAAIPSAMITGDLNAVGLNAGESVNRFITLAPRNSVMYIDTSKPTGRGRYTRIDSGVFGDMAPPLQNEFGRLATSDELIVRGVAGWMSRNAPAALDRLKLAGYTLPDGTVTTAGSEIVRAIAANIQVTPMVTYILGESQ